MNTFCSFPTWCFLSICLLKISTFINFYPFYNLTKNPQFFHFGNLKTDKITNTLRFVEVSWSILCLWLLALSLPLQYRNQRCFLEWDTCWRSYRVKFKRVLWVFGNGSRFAFVPVHGSLRFVLGFMHTFSDNGFQFFQWSFHIRLRFVDLFDFRLHNNVS